MDWKNLAGDLIRAGAPILGTALGGPLGGMIGSSVGGILASTLGVPDDPGAISNAIKNGDPTTVGTAVQNAEQLALAKYPYLVDIAKAEAEAGARSAETVNITMRQEATAFDKVQRWWRPVYAGELVIECMAMWLIFMYDSTWGSGRILANIFPITGLLSLYWTARFGVLGVYVGGRSLEKITNADQPPSTTQPAWIEQLIKALKKK